MFPGQRISGMNERRYTDLEFRQTDDGLGVVTGTVIRYGDIATLPWGTEEFKAGAFTDRIDNEIVVANRMHQRDQLLARPGAGLVIVDDEESMRAEITLPDTTAGRDTAYEVAKGLLRGLSLEFMSLKDGIVRNTHRVIEQARMSGFGVVDRPAYQGSVVTMRWAEYRSAHGLEVIKIEEKPKPVTRHFLMV